MSRSFKYLGISDDLSNMVVGSCFFWRDIGVVTYASDKMPEQRTHAITFERQKNKLVMIRSYPNFSLFISEIASQAYFHPELKYSREEIEFDHSITYNKEDTTRHPGTFLFKAKKYDIPIPSDQIKKDDEVAFFYQQVLRDYKSASTIEELQKFSERLDELSRELFSRWINRSPETALTIHKRMAGSEQKLQFIIDAEPVYLIYISPRHTSLGADGHDYILRNEDGFEIIRARRSDTFSRIMGGKDFIEPFLKSLLDTDQ